MPNKPKVNTRFLIGTVKILVSLILLGLLIWKADAGNILDVILSIPISFALLLIFLWGVAYYLITLRLQWVLANCNYPIKVLPLLRYFLWGNAFSTALPSAAGGDVVMILAMGKKQPELKWNGAAGITLNRVIALVATVIMSAIFWLGALAELSTPLIALALVAGFFVSLAAILISGRMGVKLEDFIGRLFRGKFSTTAENIGGWIRNLCTARTFFVIWFLAWLNQLVFLISSVLIINFAGIEISFPQASAALGFMTLATCLPISLGGHGIREASLAGTILYFAPALPVEGVINGTLSYSAIFLGITLIWAGIGVGLHHYFDKQR